MEQHLGRQSGVQKVHVSLIDGKVEITPKDDHLIDPVQILKATYDSGVSVAEMSMTAHGQIVKDSAGKITFVIDSSKTFPVVQNDLAKELDEIKAATMRGILYQKQQKDKKQLSFTPLEIQQKE